jgi:hypothetical protein
MVAMAATPSDIAKYTTDGVRLVAPTNAAIGDAIKAAHIDARDGDSDEIEMFYDDPADGQAMLNERFAIESIANPVSLGLEVEESLGLGATIPLTPAVPVFTVVDTASGFSAPMRVSGYAADMGADRYSVAVRQ